jgi:hypothetical protein
MLIILDMLDWGTQIVFLLTIFIMYFVSYVIHI